MLNILPAALIITVIAVYFMPITAAMSKVEN